MCSVGLVLACLCIASSSRRLQSPRLAMRGGSLFSQQHAGHGSQELAHLLLRAIEPPAGWQASGCKCSLRHGEHQAELCSAGRARFLVMCATPVPIARQAKLQTGEVEFYSVSSGRGFIECNAVSDKVNFMEKDLPEEIQKSPKSMHAASLVSKTVTFFLEVGDDGQLLATDLSIKQSGFDYEQAFTMFANTLSKPDEVRGKESRKNWRDNLQTVCSAIRSGEWSIVNTTLDSPIIWSIGSWRGMLNAASQVKDWTGAVQLIHRMEGAGYAHDVDAYGYAIGACCNAGEPGSAKKLLERLEDGAKVPFRFYDQVLSALARRATWKEALELLTHMEDKGMRPRSQSFKSVAEACSQAKHPKESLEVLQRLNASSRAAADKVGDTDSFDSFAYVQMIKSLVQEGRWKKAISIYDELPPHVERSDLLLDAAVEAAAAGKDANTTVRMIEDALDSNKIPRTSSFNIALGSLVTAKLPQTSLRLLERMRGTGIRPNLISYNAVLRALSNVGYWEQSINILTEMQLAKVKPTVASYNHVLGACLNHAKSQCQFSNVYPTSFANANASLVPLTVNPLIERSLVGDASQDGFADDAKKTRSTMVDKVTLLLLEMQNSGLKPDVVTYFSVTAVLARYGEYSRIMDMVGSQGYTGAQPDAYALSAAMSACERSGQWQMALGLFEAIRETNETIHPSLWNSALSAAGSSGDVQLALSLLEELRSDGVNVTLRAYNAALKACEKAADGDAAMGVFHDIKVDGLQPNSFSYAFVVSALGRAQQWMSALGVYQQMLLEGVKVDKITLSTLLRALTYGGQWQKSLDTFERALVFYPDACTEIVYAAAFEACAVGAQDDRAMDLFQGMRKRKRIPSVDCYHGLLAAFVVADNDWFMTMKLFNDMLSQGMVPRQDTWSLVHDYLEAGGHEEEADSLADMAQQYGVPLRIG